MTTNLLHKASPGKNFLSLYPTCDLGSTKPSSIDFQVMEFFLHLSIETCEAKFYFIQLRFCKIFSLNVLREFFYVFCTLLITQTNSLRGQVPLPAACLQRSELTMDRSP